MDIFRYDHPTKMFVLYGPCARLYVQHGSLGTWLYLYIYCLCINHDHRWHRIYMSSDRNGSHPLNILIPIYTESFIFSQISSKLVIQAYGKNYMKIDLYIKEGTRYQIFAMFAKWDRWGFGLVHDINWARLRNCVFPSYQLGFFFIFYLICYYQHDQCLLTICLRGHVYQISTFECCSFVIF